METFVVRVYTSTDPLTEGDPQPRGLCGVVQHVHSGRTRTFRGAEELERVITEEASSRLASARAVEVETA